MAVVLLACSMLGCDRPAAVSADPAARVPVLFVHGSGLDSGLWSDLRRHLIANGYSPQELLAVDMQPRDGSNPRAARRFIAPAVEELLQRSAVVARRQHRRPAERVDIVAHSMGAISSRWYMAFMQPERVRLWIGIAPANHGTNALCGYKGDGDQELCPAFASSEKQSAIQAQLNGTVLRPLDVTPFGLGMDPEPSVAMRPDVKRCIVYFTVRIDPDEWIKPERSALLDGAGGLTVDVTGLPLTETSAGNFLFTAPIIHDDLPRHIGVAEFVERAAQAADADHQPRCQAEI